MRSSRNISCLQLKWGRRSVERAELRAFGWLSSRLARLSRLSMQGAPFEGEAWPLVSSDVNPNTGGCSSWPSSLPAVACGAPWPSRLHHHQGSIIPPSAPANPENPANLWQFSWYNPHIPYHLYQSWPHGNGQQHWLAPVAQPVGLGSTWFNCDVHFSRSGSEDALLVELTEEEATMRDRELLQSLRQWVPFTSPEESIQMEQSSFNFKLVSYNVLAQDLLDEHAYLYKKHHQKALLWNTRWRNLLQEISDHDADILCLQEVQQSHIERYYDQLKELGYEGLFKKRTGYRTDGCAIYYKTSVFRLLEYTTVEYNQSHVHILDRDNVAIVARFAPVTQPSKKIVVATTHLLYNPRRQDIRLAQTQILLAELDRMAFKSLSSSGVAKYHPIIVTGDLNSEPFSAVLELITEGRLQYENLSYRTLVDNGSANVTGRVLMPAKLRITDQCQHADLVPLRENKQKLSRDKEEQLIRLQHYGRAASKSSKSSNQTRQKRTLEEEAFSTGTLSHSLNLRSVFKYHVDDDTEATTYQDQWITVDYIFYSEKDLSVSEVYSVPTTKQMQRVRHIPNFVLGSDHLALAAKFTIL